jgi:hypothetical protein
MRVFSVSPKGGLYTVKEIELTSAYSNQSNITACPMDCCVSFLKCAWIFKVFKINTNRVHLFSRAFTRAGFKFHTSCECSDRLLFHNWVHTGLYQRRCGPYKATGTSFKYIKRHVFLTGFMLWPYIYGHFLGYFFTGAYFPQKLDLLPSLERERNSVQRHVSSYQVKISEGCFVWAAPTLLRGGPYLKMEDNSLRGANTVEVSNPACGKAREVWHDSISNIQINRSCIEYRNTHMTSPN